MKYDFHAHYPLPCKDSFTQSDAIDYLSGANTSPPKNWPELNTIIDDSAKMELLSQALMSPHKEKARMGQMRGQLTGMGQWILSKKADAFLDEQWKTFIEPLGLYTPMPDLELFPDYSFALNFTFRLKTPYLSSDDTAFSIWDNPVRKDKVFGLSLVSSTGWKGALRATLCLVEGDKESDNIDLLNSRLFGEAIEDESGKAGRLHFYPTFFTQIGLEVINPHNRKTGTGEHPIYIETVPAEAEGDFALLYVPFDMIGKDRIVISQEVSKDLYKVVKAIHAMMTIYGFGAKTSSGFGIVEENLVSKGILKVKMADTERKFDNFGEMAEVVKELKKALITDGKEKNND